MVIIAQSRLFLYTVFCIAIALRREPWICRNKNHMRPMPLLFARFPSIFQPQSRPPNIPGFNLPSPPASSCRYPPHPPSPAIPSTNSLFSAQCSLINAASTSPQFFIPGPPAPFPLCPWVLRLGHRQQHRGSGGALERENFGGKAGKLPVQTVVRKAETEKSLCAKDLMTSEGAPQSQCKADSTLRYL